VAVSIINKTKTKNESVADLKEKRALQAAKPGSNAIIN
jgi:hypothetical protein